nr:sulfotransferase [Salinibacter ruber]
MFIPGAQKSGTTSLFVALCNHSQIQEPRHKEPHFFAQSRSVIEKNTDWYLENIQREKKGVSVDASTAYMADERTPKILYEHFPEAKILILLRDPVRRAFSSYVHMQRKTPKYDYREFGEIMGRLENKSKTSLLERERQATRRARQQGLIRDYLTEDYHERKFGASFRSSFRDPEWAHRYFSYSQYSRIVNSYTSRFDNVKLVIFEELLQEPGAVLSEIAKFLGIDQRELRFPHAHESRVPSAIGRIYARMREQGQHVAHTLNALRDGFDTLMKTIGAEQLAVKARRLLRRKPKLKEDQYMRARSLLSTEYAYWRDRRPVTKKLWHFS